MRKRFVLAFVVLFALFALGIATSLVFIWRGSKELREVIEMHQVEDLRQALSQRLKRSQSDLQVSGTVFANQLDDIIANVQALDDSVKGCFDCHHEPALQRELEQISELVEAYKRQYSTFITAFLNPESRQRLQIEAATTASEIDTAVDSLLLAARPLLQLRTEAATAQVDRSWQMLVITLVATFVVAIVISSLLTRSVTEPVQRLVVAAERIRSGELGYRLLHRQEHEMGALMDTFNAMSETLESKTERIEGHVERLHRLNEVLVSVHEQPHQEQFFARLVGSIDELMEVELRGSILATDLEDVFLVSLSPRGETVPYYRTAISVAKLEKIRSRGSSSTLVVEEGEADSWPFGLRVPLPDCRNYLVCWIDHQGELRGGLVVANKASGAFDAEDEELLHALGNGVNVAHENARSFRRLQIELELLRSRAGSDLAV